MRNNLIKKYSVSSILAIYILAYFLQSFSFFDFGLILDKTYAENQLDYTNLVAIFVDDKIYDDIDDDIKRYAQTYIQGENNDNRHNSISNSKAIVLPVDIENVSAVDITKILENIYFDGISGEPSKLIGTILVGDIPLPVVNQDGFIYPTIYPYVDFEEQKFIWDDKFKYFVYNDNPDGKAEVWHGIINFDEISDYDIYFDKLRNYSDEPSEFIGKSIWYDDLVANKQYFNNSTINSYINNFMFAEDLGHRRYTDLMVKLLQGSHNDMVAELMEGFEGMDELNAATEDMNTPTMSLKKMIEEGYLKSYTSLIGPKQLDNIITNVETANRWTEQYTGSDGVVRTRTSLDTHYMKTELKDETLLRMNGGLDPLILTFNNVLEDILNDKIEKEEYWMNEVIPLSYLKYNGDVQLNWWNFWAPRRYDCLWEDYDAFENYFFGANARNITSMKETSTYRGTFRNLDDINGLTIDDIQNSYHPSSDIADKIDLNKKSVGGSYDIFSTQVDANRGFNINNTVNELDIYNHNKVAKRELWRAECNFEFWDICRSKRTWKASTEEGDECNPGGSESERGGCELPSDFAIRNRGGASPLNLSGMNDRQKGYDFQDAVLPIFDIAGSKKLSTNEPSANSFDGVNDYSRLIQKTFVPDNSSYYSKNKSKKQPAPSGKGYDSSMGEEMKFTNREAYNNFNNPSRRYISPRKASDIDYFSKYDGGANWEGDILKIKKNTWEMCVGRGEIFTYKTLDSRVWNTLTTKDQIGGVGFKVFQDPSSPSKILNEGIQDKILRVNETLDTNIDRFDINNVSGVVYKIDELGDYIRNITSGISNITGQTMSQLDGLSSTQIQAKANEWKNYFVSQDLVNITGYVDDIKYKFISLNDFVGTFGYNDIDSYIDTQLYNFKVNKWNLIFYNTWKTNILSNLVSTKNKYRSIDGLLNIVKSDYYDEIPSIYIPSVRQIALDTKKLQIHGSILSGGVLPVGCRQDYAPLCGAIDTLKNNLITYGNDANDAVYEILEFQADSATTIKPFITIGEKALNQGFINDHNSTSSTIGGFPISDDIDLTENKEGMNLTTSNRPIDSPKYITFKGIGGDKVSFVYPNLYKSEIFEGDSSILNLKSPDAIAEAIKDYLRKKVDKYNDYLSQQASKKQNYYNQNAAAFNKLASHDLLASPNSPRSYNEMDDDFLINELENRISHGVFFMGQMDDYDPIEFIAHMIYYQNIGRQQREVGDTIQSDMNNIREEFDVNNKISHIVDNYLIKDNNRGNFITPGYRDDGYEVAFINSNGSDYIDYKGEPSFIQRVKGAANNFKKPSTPATEQSNLEEGLLNNCNIPEDGGVMIFDLQEGGSPWGDALKCWREQIIETPFEFEFDRSSVQGPPITFGEEGDSVGEVIADNLGVDNIQSQYMNQLDLLDTDDENQEVLDNSSPGDYKKLEKISSYTKLKTNTKTINADNTSGAIEISSSIELGDVEFHIENIGDSIINFEEDEFTLDPFNTKSLKFNINTPIDGINVIMFHMCLPGTQDINNCVKKSIRIDIIPGDIASIKIETPGDKILEGSKMPISVLGLDTALNNVGQLIGQKFTINTSKGLLGYKSSVGDELQFSDFNKSKFTLDSKGLLNGEQITLKIDGNINGNDGIQDTTTINVIKGDIKVEYNDNILSDTDKIHVYLTSTNEYTYKDGFKLSQVNLNTVPKINLKLVDEANNPINIKSIANISSTKGLLKPGLLDTRMIKKTQDSMTFEVEQNRFKGETNHIISNGEAIVYLMPNFKAGDDILYINMPGIDTIEIPIVVHPAPASMIKLTTKKDEIATNSNTKANFKIFDNWENIITQDTVVKLGAIGPINISGFSNSSTLINVQGGEYNFDINSQEQGGAGFIYALINDLSLDEQMPGNAVVTVQSRILPDKDLNIMYLNLFGSDRGNQRGYLSENNKYIEDLIINSEKLITTTTQLVSPKKIKKFAVMTDDKLQISNIEEKNIKLNINDDEGINIIDIHIQDIGHIELESSTFKIKEVDVSDENTNTVIDALIDNYNDDNILIYLPEETDSIIESNEINNNAIYINNENIFDLDNAIFDDQLKITLSTNFLVGYQIWNVLLSNKKIGQILISIENQSSLNLTMSVYNPIYDYNTVWLDGSTNRNGIGFYEIDSSLDDNTMGYDSIQNSLDPTLGLGFVADFKNITNFGAGESVGDATLPFSSEFLINIGDPLLKMIDENVSAKIYDEDGNLDTDTGFDKGLGEIIYSEPGKTIFKVINIDFNHDGLEDVLVSFTDGSIKILKNYGGNNPFEQLGDLMILADGIKEIIIGDVDGNDYEDIIIWSKSDTLRVYKNEEGIFDVDGYPICININVKKDIISDSPQDISGIFQIFFEDMDQDGNLDIVINDKLGYIKIFYGGSDNPEGLDNYVSNDKYKCDDGRYGRENYGNDTENPNTKVAYRFGIRVNENVKVLDQSSIHRQGINETDQVDITAEDLGVDTDMFSDSNMEDMDSDDIDALIAEAMNFDVGAAEDGYMVSQRYKDGTFGKIPEYEDDIEEEVDIKYVEIGCLTGSDPVDIYKKYNDINGDVLEDGDIVEISIILKANETFVGTFVDRVSGPWKIALLDDGMIEHFWFDTGSISQETIDNELKFHWKMERAMYMIDNIKLSAGEELKINYWVTYDGDVQTNKIGISDVNGADYERGANGMTGDTMGEYSIDNYPDIKIKPSDGCNKSMFILFNKQNINSNTKDYKPEYVDLTEIMIAYSAANQANLDNAMSDVTNALSDNAASGEAPDMNNIAGLGEVLESWNSTDILGDTFNSDEIISQGGVDLSNIANAPSQLLDSLLGDTMDKVDDFMGGLCDGFDLSEMGVGGGGGCGLPIPFNQGFLGPGKYHVFGCFEIPPLSETLGKGLPVLNFPGNRGPIPAGGYLPFPGIFGLPFKGPTDGFLGISGGPYSSMFRLYLVPTLTAELGIAMCFGPYTVGDAIPDPVSSIAGNCVVFSIPLCGDDGGGGGPNSSNAIPPAFLDLEPCTNQNVPCHVGPGESSSSLELVSSSSASTNMTSAVPDGSFAGGFINIEKDPVTTHGYNTPESGIEIDGVNLFGGADAKNKILGGAAQGLIEKLAKNWMDKQINYIISNLTNFKIDVYWPDFSGMMGGMGKGGLSSALENEKKKDCQDQKGQRNDAEGETKARCYISEKQRCENRGKERKQKDGSYGCFKKMSPNQNDDALGKVDSLAQNKLLDRGQITNLEDSSFANPFEKIEAMFEEVPLINIRTENITVKVPMISSEDITAYIHMSRNRIKTQERILKEWLDLLKALVGWCGGKEDIENFSDLKDAVIDLKDQMKAQMADNIAGVKKKLDDVKEKINDVTDPEEKEKLKKEQKDLEEEEETAKKKIKAIEKKIEGINKLNDKYDLNALGDYEIYESCAQDGFFIKFKSHNTDSILPYDIYLFYKKNAGDDDQELIMFSKGFDLIKKEKRKKIIITYEKNKDMVNNDGVCLNKFVDSKENQCMDLFLGGKFDLILNDFLNIQAGADGLITSVRQNLETLELYKKFPLDLYEWIHVGDRYMSEISSIINNFLGTLSLWMETNATRYSQYVDSLILIMTTIQTYQAIIDLSANWSEKCSSCTNDNYDQFACKLSLLCPDNLPIFKIPPMKIPSIYIDLSHMNLATDIKLPKFNFVPTGVPLPSLPNIPEPPTIDLSLSMDELMSLGLNIIEGLLIKLDDINLSLTLPSIPVIPSPPDLPEIPSFLPSVKMELPLLPPAPKIPSLPNEITVAIEIAEVIGQILCIVKGNIGLVGEASIKAKVEQMTQRDYEIPFWDNLDQTLSERNQDGGVSIPGWISDMFGFLKSNEFEDVELKGFDLGIESYVNLQYNFAGFYDFIDQVVGEINKYSGMPAEFMQDGIDSLDEASRAAEAKMRACVSNPISEACMGGAYTGEIKDTKERSDDAANQLDTMGNAIEEGFDGVKEAKQIIAEKENEKEAAEEIIEKVNKSNTMITDKLTTLNLDVGLTTDDVRKKSLGDEIEKFKKDYDINLGTIEENNSKLDIIDTELEILHEKYDSSIESYETYLENYGSLLGEFNAIKEKLSGRADDAMGAVNDGIGGANDLIDGVSGLLGQEELKAKMEEFDKKQDIRRDIRDKELDGLFKPTGTPSAYIEYDDDVYHKNIAILQDRLYDIKDSTSNILFKEEIDKYIKLSSANNDISPAINNINTVMQDYTKIVGNHLEQNKLIYDTIGNDYDKFLYAVEGNDVTLVGNDDINIELSSNLFDIDKNVLQTIKQQENINKLYLDYNSNNINGYINALESNTPEQLNMDEDLYNENKNYLYHLKEKTKLAYNIIDKEKTSNSILNNKERKLLAQSTSSNSAGAGVVAFTDISSYIYGKTIVTPEGSFDLANDEYVSEFQGKNILVDINDDGANDLLLRDRNNLYVKYRNGNNLHDNEEYSDNYYKYHISSYEDLIDDSDDGFVKINNIYLKVCDLNWEIKNFKYNGGDFDSIKVTWMNSSSMGDMPAGYLIKMIHRVDLFNDKESIVSNSNEELFDKKYILVLPKGAPLTGTKITLEEGTYRTEDILSGLIFDTMEYNENIVNINLTIQDIPRNRQYSEIYTLDLYEDSLYVINNTSSNQIVAGPQIIADNKGPKPIITLYRPSINTVIDTGDNFDTFVSTRYILQSNWEDNVSIEKLRIADEEGNNIAQINDINEKTGYIELDGLFFTGAGVMNYYFGATDINGNSNVKQVSLKIKIPSIEIVDIQKYGNEIENISSPATITAKIEHDLDEGYVTFNRYRNDIRQTITGTLGGIDIDKYDLEPLQTIITGGYYDFGNDIGLYLPSGELAVKINPNNGKISILDGFENRVNIQLDYSNKTPMIKVVDNQGNILFLVSLPVKELISLNSSLEIQDLDGDVFGDFNGGKAILSNNEVWIYIGPNGEIYTEGNVYGNYSFDDINQTVQYGFKQNPGGSNLGSIKVKIENLLGE